jgi:hypothetical protein
LVLRLVEELSKSRTGKHAVRRMVLIVSKDGSVRKPEGRGGRVKPIYAEGEARLVEISDLRDNEVAVYIHLVRNPRGRVKGYMEVYDRDGALVYRAVYRKLKLRYSKGNPRYSWAVRIAAEHIRLPVKRYNLVPAWSRR